MENVQLVVKAPQVVYPVMVEKDGQAKRRERRKNQRKDNARWHMNKSS